MAVGHLLFSNAVLQIYIYIILILIESAAPLLFMYTNLLLRFSEKRDLFSYSGSCGEDLDKNKETVMSVSTLEGG